MRSKTNNTRRATQDLDIDFIKYSLSDDAIKTFIKKINCIEGIKIIQEGNIEELKQQDYSGKRVFVTIEDKEGNYVKCKIDLGVHNRFELEQEEYCFDIACDDYGVSLLINSNEQIFAEKLRSLLKFGPFSTRFKDVYDMYYLKDLIDVSKLKVALNVHVFNDDNMREKNKKDILKRLKFTFNDKVYIQSLDKSDKRWIDENISEITNEILEVINRI